MYCVYIRLELEVMMQLDNDGDTELEVTMQLDNDGDTVPALVCLLLPQHYFFCKL